MSELETNLEDSLGIHRAPAPKPPPDPDLSPGLHPNFPARVYHRRKLGVVSKSTLDLVRRSPLHYHAWATGKAPDEDTPALAFGRAFHMALLEPDRFREEYAEQPDFGDCRKSANKARRDDWREANASKAWLSNDDGSAIAGMTYAVRRHSLASKMIREGLAELTMCWKDRETGLLCKSRCDYYVKSRAMIVDVKSTLDASWDAFKKDIAKYAYHVQDALYRFGATELDLPVQHFVFIAVEKSPPFAVAVYTLEADGIGRGYSAARRDMNTLAECMRTNTWPGYPPGIQTIDLPPWAA